MQTARIHIQLKTLSKIIKFVSKLNEDSSTDYYSIENFDKTIKVNARSILGVIYALTNFGNEMYFTNETEPFAIPLWIEKYRV